MASANSCTNKGGTCTDWRYTTCNAGYERGICPGDNNQRCCLYCSPTCEANEDFYQGSAKYRLFKMSAFYVEPLVSNMMASALPVVVHVKMIQIIATVLGKVVFAEVVITDGAVLELSLSPTCK